MGAGAFNGKENLKKSQHKQTKPLVYARHTVLLHVAGEIGMQQTR